VIPVHPEFPLARALGIPTEALEAARALAVTLATHGERTRARRVLEGCLALDGGDFESAIALAELALSDGDAAGALDAAGRALAAGGGESRAPDAALLFARALLLAGHRVEARAWLERLAASAGPERDQAALLLERVSPSSSVQRDGRCDRTEIPKCTRAPRRTC
jgi:hypothetical protein